MMMDGARRFRYFSLLFAYYFRYYAAFSFFVCLFHVVVSLLIGFVYRRHLSCLLFAFALILCLFHNIAYHAFIYTHIIIFVFIIFRFLLFTII